LAAKDEAGGRETKNRESSPQMGCLFLQRTTLNESAKKFLWLWKSSATAAGSFLVADCDQ